MLNGLLHFFRFANSACGTRTGTLPSLYDNLGCVDGAPTISSLSDIIRIVENLIRILIAISGALAVILILAAAVYYVISGGDPSKIKRAKDILLNTVIGLVLIISAYAIVTYIAGGF